MPEELPISIFGAIEAGDLGGPEFGVPAADLASRQLTREQAHKRHMANKHGARRRGKDRIPAFGIIVRIESGLLPYPTGRK